MKILFVIALLASGAAFGASSPEEVAGNYAQAIVKEDWRAAVSYFRPSDLKRIRTAFAKPMADLRSEGLRQQFFGPLSAEAIATMSDAEFCERIFFGYFAGLREKGVDFQFKESAILGVVRDGNDKAYVVMKQKATVAGLQTESVDLTPTVREAGEWFVTMPEQFEAVISMLESR